MNVFVTGGTGFLGRAVLESLVADGHSVRALVRDGRSVPSGVEPSAVSLEDAAGLERALGGVDAIVHLAGLVSRDPADGPRMHHVHLELTRTLLDAAERTRVSKLVLASTSGTIAVRETKDSRPATESESSPIELIGRWPYYVSKRYQEDEILRRDRAGRIEAVILNPSLLLGPGDERLSSTADVHKALHGRFPALTKGVMAIVDVRDVAPMFVAALMKGRRGQRYLLNGANLNVRSFVDRVEAAGDVMHIRPVLSDRWARRSTKVLEGLYKVIDRTPPVDPISVDMACCDWSCTSAKAEKELGFSARDVQVTIADTVRDLERRGLFRRT
ncbi:MAG: NAD-dependent epimerase/dehydratase family protein [Deltaproteobacteria bacterium]|nr:NAD-dependent epimerase/dehydratase family protein [Deltaproteobacteria bacterium]